MPMRWRLRLSNRGALSVGMRQSCVPFGVEGSGFGFKVVHRLTAAEASLPTTCQMQRPGS